MFRFSFPVGMKNLTRVKILPTRVESKNNIGALKIEVVKLKKKAVEAFNPRCAPMLVLRNANTVPPNEINE